MHFLNWAKGLAMSPAFAYRLTIDTGCRRFYRGHLCIRRFAVRDARPSTIPLRRVCIPKYSQCCVASEHGNHTSSSTMGYASLSSQPVTVLCDTIFALSSGAGVTAGVAIIRVSGPDATFSLEKLLRLNRSNASFPRARYATLRKLYHPLTSELLDEGMVLHFPGPRSFTGEDVVEFHIHGSRAVIAGLIDALSSLQQSDGHISTIRPAERGEFTRRAFENGRMDLTGVEGLADLISAETAMQRKQALRQLGGEVRDLLEKWREEIKGCLAHAEAVIDFGDDVDDDAFEAIVPKIDVLCKELQRHLNDDRRGEIVRGGARVAIVGEPNAGKSTLLNALARRPAAIVSPLAGTTRDIVEVQLDLNGMAVIVSDTAGLRQETQDPIELEGMKRAREAASNADITILVHDASQGGLEDAIESFPARIRVQEAQNDTQLSQNPGLICVANKIDLVAETKIAKSVCGVEVFKTSLVENVGIVNLIDRLEAILRKRLGDLPQGTEGPASETSTKNGNVPVITRARHRYHLGNAVAALNSFIEGRTGEDRDLYLPMDLATEDLRIAGIELGAITGVIHAEEVLDVIFSEFCIGK